MRALQALLATVLRSFLRPPNLQKVLLRQLVLPLLKVLFQILECRTRILVRKVE